MREMKIVTPKEAVELLESKYHMEGQIDNVLECLAIRNTAVEALKKQIPQKTIIKIFEEDVNVGRVIFKAGTKVHHCPECLSVVTGSQVFCSRCGQALIW